MQEYNRTPLHASSVKGHLEVTRLLLDRGGDPKAKNRDGVTPLHRLSFYGHLEVTRLLLDRGGDPKANDGGGSTPLHLSSRGGRLEVTRLLLERGADPTIKNNVSVAACVLRSRVCATRLGVRAGVGWPLLRPSDRSSLRLSASCVRSSPRRACACSLARRPWISQCGTAVTIPTLPKPRCRLSKTTRA